MRKFCKRSFFILVLSLLVTLLVGFATVAHQARAGDGVGCVASAQAGVQEVTIEGGQETVIVLFRRYCQLPVVVATGSEGVSVQIGVTTPSSVTLIITGPDAAVRVNWHAMPQTK